jgi:hypothetical protein
MRKLNVARMKRYVARSTPDTVQRRFDGMGGENIEDQYAQWLMKLKKSWGIKHGEGVGSIDIFTRQDYASQEYIITVSWKES